jgi:hypothetical protein
MAVGGGIGDMPRLFDGTTIDASGGAGVDSRIACGVKTTPGVGVCVS